MVQNFALVSEKCRAATRGKTVKILGSFLDFVDGGGSGSGSGGPPVMWLPLWGSCLPEFYRTISLLFVYFHLESSPKNL